MVLKPRSAGLKRGEWVPVVALCNHRLWLGPSKVQENFLMLSTLGSREFSDCFSHLLGSQVADMEAKERNVHSVGQLSYA